MDAATIARYRLASQQIADATPCRPHEVVARLGAVQAQDYAAALWAIGVRLPAATEADVEQAVAAGTLVRTWPLRGTLHLVAAADVRWLLDLLGPRTIAASALRRRQLEIDDETIGRCRETVADALQGGVQLTRETLCRLLEEAGIAAAGQRGLHILRHLALEGLICFGARQGKQPTFVLLDEWVPAAGRLEREAALAELARRYFTGHGPATLQDFVWWSGLTIAEARAGLDGAAARLVREMSGGNVYWRGPGAPAEIGPHDVWLLPAFDEYLLGYRERGAVLDPAYATRVVPGNNGMFLPIIVAGGQIAGVWKRTLARRSVAISYHPFAPLSAAQSVAALAAAERYAAFLGLPLAAA